MNYINELFFDEPGFEEPDLDDNHVCHRCKTEFDSADNLVYTGEHLVCSSCRADLTMQAAEETMDI